MSCKAGSNSIATVSAGRSSSSRRHQMTLYGCTVEETLQALTGLLSQTYLQRLGKSSVTVRVLRTQGRSSPATTNATAPSTARTCRRPTSLLAVSRRRKRCFSGVTGFRWRAMQAGNQYQHVEDCFA